MPTTAPPRWLWWILGAVHLAAYGYALSTGHWFFPDSDRYLEAARNLLHHGTLYAWPWPPTSPQEYSIRPPGYPLLLAAVGIVPVLFLLVQNGLALLNVWLVARWLARHTSGLTARRWGLFLLLALTAPANVVYANTAMSETLLQTLVVGLWLTLTRFVTTGKRRALRAAALLTAAALLVKPVFLPFAFLFVVGCGVLVVRSSIRKTPSAHRPTVNLLIAALPLLVALGWQARNYAHTGYWHFSAIADINLLRYNTSAVLRAADGPAAADAFVRRTIIAAEALPTFAAQQHYMQRAASAALARHLPTYLGLHLRGMVNCLLDPGRFDLTEFVRLPATTPGLSYLMDAGGYFDVGKALARQPWTLLVVLGLVLIGNVVRLIGFGLFLLNRQLPLAARLVAAGLVLYVIGLTGPLGAARFLVPVLPLLLCSVVAWGTAPRQEI